MFNSEPSRTNALNSEPSGANALKSEPSGGHAQNSVPSGRKCRRVRSQGQNSVPSGRPEIFVPSGAGRPPKSAVREDEQKWSESDVFAPAADTFGVPRIFGKFWPTMEAVCNKNLPKGSEFSSLTPNPLWLLRRGFGIGRECAEGSRFRAFGPYPCRK